MNRLCLPFAILAAVAGSLALRPSEGVTLPVPPVLAVPGHGIGLIVAVISLFSRAASH
ncbi:hypothetical protein [Sediminicoccus sp. BL-A-41-H5]|uniref:hypothetical protein n=1 Tax=Sediminicoccus sp. BL-A-41-H5 TaxID=3421106 RepID=UPI003D67DF36